MEALLKQKQFETAALLLPGFIAPDDPGRWEHFIKKFMQKKALGQLLHSVPKEGKLNLKIYT